MAAAAETLLYGTAISISGRAALIRGPSGSGKSDLALRCLAIAAGPLITAIPELVSDDQVFACRTASIIELSPPPAIAGKIEVRGLGIFNVNFAAASRLVVILDIVTGSIDRLPDPVPREMILGVGVPVLQIAPFEASSAVKALLAIAMCDG